MLRPNGSFFEQIAYFERPIPALLATRVFAPRARPACNAFPCRPWSAHSPRRVFHAYPSHQIPDSTSTGREQVRVREVAQSFTSNYVWPHELDESTEPVDELFEPEEAPIYEFEDTASDYYGGQDQYHTIPRYTADSDSLFEDEIITPISKSRQRRLTRRSTQRRAHHEGDLDNISPIIRRTEEQITSSSRPKSLKAWAVALGYQHSSPTSSASNVTHNPTATEIPTTTEIKSWIEDLDLDNASESAARKYWDGFAYDERARRWPCLMSHYLHNSSDQALRFLRHIVPSYEPPGQHISEVLGRLAGATEYGYRTGEPIISLWDTLQFTVDTIATRPPLTQKTIYAALRGLNTQKLYAAMDWLAFNHYRVNPSVLHLLARSLAADGYVRDALIFFKQIVHAVGPRKDTSLDDTATRIVLCAIGDAGDYASGMDAVRRIVRTRTSLVRPTFKVLFAKAIETGDVRLAWDLLEELKLVVRAPTDEVYGMMMKMSRRLGDREGYKELYKRLRPESRRFLDPHLIAEILRCRHAFNARDNFDHILRFYERHCNVRPLRVLGVVPPDYVSRFALFYPQPRPDPGPVALSVILGKYITAQYAAQPVIRFYLRFLRALRERDPEIMALANSEQIWRSFIKAFGKRNSFVSTRRRRYGRRDRPIYWENILRSMLPWMTTESDCEAGDEPSKSFPGLSRVTWNIVLNAVARHGKLIVVEDILKRMRSNGLEPDTVTWNSLLTGFARFQHVYLVADILRRMKLANVQFDSHTTRALGLVWDRAGLAQAMKAMDDDVDKPLGDSVSSLSFTQLRARVMALEEHVGQARGRQHWSRAAGLYRGRRSHALPLKRDNAEATVARSSLSGSTASPLHEGNA